MLLRSDQMCPSSCFLLEQSCPGVDPGLKWGELSKEVTDDGGEGPPWLGAKTLLWPSNHILELLPDNPTTAQIQKRNKKYLSLEMYLWIFLKMYLSYLYYVFCSNHTLGLLPDNPPTTQSQNMIWLFILKYICPNFGMYFSTTTYSTLLKNWTCEIKDPTFNEIGTQ